MATKHSFFLLITPFHVGFCEHFILSSRRTKGALSVPSAIPRHNVERNGKGSMRPYPVHDLEYAKEDSNNVLDKHIGLITMSKLQRSCLPVIIITTEEAASAHINVLLFLFLFLLLLLLLLSRSSSSSASSRGSSASSGNGDKLLKSLLDHFLDVLSLEVSQELLDLLVLSLSADGFKNALDVIGLDIKHGVLSRTVGFSFPPRTSMR